MRDNKQVVTEMYAAFANLPDDLAILDLLDPDCVWRIPGIAIYQGKQDIAENLLLPFGRGMESLGIMEITIMISEGDIVVAEGFARGRYTKSGKRYNNTYCTLFEVREGRIRLVSEYCDTRLVHDVFGGRPRETQNRRKPADHSNQSTIGQARLFTTTPEKKGRHVPRHHG